MYDDQPNGLLGKPYLPAFVAALAIVLILIAILS